jgi:hypothetical protein
MSRLPPGADGAMMRTGCAGHGASARNRRGHAQAAKADAAARNNVRRVVMQKLKQIARQV